MPSYVNYAAIRALNAASSVADAVRVLNPRDPRTTVTDRMWPQLLQQTCRQAQQNYQVLRNTRDDDGPRAIASIVRSIHLNYVTIQYLYENEDRIPAYIAQQARDRQRFVSDLVKHQHLTDLQRRTLEHELSNLEFLLGGDLVDIHETPATALEMLAAINRAEPPGIDQRLYTQMLQPVDHYTHTTWEGETTPEIRIHLATAAVIATASVTMHAIKLHYHSLAPRANVVIAQCQQARQARPGKPFINIKVALTLGIGLTLVTAGAVASANYYGFIHLY